MYCSSYHLLTGFHSHGWCETSQEGEVDEEDVELHDGDWRVKVYVRRFRGGNEMIWTMILGDGGCGQVRIGRIRSV